MFETLAQATTPDSITQIQGWIQIGTSAGFAGLVWYLITQSLPAMQKRFDDHSNARMDEFVRQLEATRQAHAAVMANVTAAHEKQLDRILSLRERT